MRQQELRPSTVPPVIAAALEVAGSQIQLSRAININDRTIRRWLDGVHRPSRDTAEQMLDFLSQNNVTNFSIKDFELIA
mgnify:CR=1 FL=1|tara:strand:- start:528 stop:764 length:237 start_codon:yes stop_codon:yes gene_type:complete